MKTLELKGFKSLRAFNAFHTLMLGMKMLPMYKDESYDEFYARIELMPHEDQLKIVREGTKFVPLEPEEVEAMICFCADKNGVPYTKENMKNLKPQEILDAIISVSGEILKMKIDLVSNPEKKNSKDSALT